MEAAIDDDGTSDKDFYVLLNYSFKFNDIENTTKSNSNAFELETVENRMYEKVIRENRVIKVVKGAVKVKRGN